MKLRVIKQPGLLLVLLFMFTSFSLSAQNISLNEKQAEFTAVLKKIKQQSGLDVLGDLQQIQETNPVTIQVSNMPLADVLKILSKQQRFDMIIYNNAILIKARSNNHTSSNYLFKGQVVDESQDPVAGASVSVQNSNKGTITDTKGGFELEVNTADVLIITSVGYEPLEFKVDGKQSAKIILHEQAKSIEEVLVSTGYTRRKKESMTGASTIITRKELENFNTNNIFSLIQSLDPAFRVAENNSNGSNPNAIPQITIRGTNSVGEYAVNAPLIMIDGIQSTVQALYDLDVDRIESISILKDASSTVLYGSRGGNGVIVIETRLPKSGRFTVTYEGRPSFTQVDLSGYNLMNATQKLEYEKLAGVYTSKAVNDQDYREREQAYLDNMYAAKYLNVLSGVNTDWLSQPVQSAFSMGHSLRVEGGNDAVRYSIDGSYNNFKGVMKKSGRDIGGAGFNLIYRIPDKITFRNYTSFTSTKEYNSPYGDFSLYTYMNPYEKIYDANNDYIISYNNDFLSSDRRVAFNPLYNASLPYRNNFNTVNIANTLSLEWFISKYFIFRGTGIIQKRFLDGENYQSPFHTDYINTASGLRGLYRMSNGGTKSYFANAQITYAQNFGKHSINALALSEMQDINETLTSNSVTGFADDTYISPGFAKSYIPNSVPVYLNSPSRLMSLMGSGNYIYANKYVLEGSYRMDGSSKFGINNRYSNFWSFGVGYNLHKEAFMQNGLFSLLRLYANTGTNGSDNFNSNMTNTAYAINGANAYYTLVGLGYVNEGNPNLRWPQIRSYTAGFDSKFWKDRVSVSVSLYKKITDKMISPIRMAPSLGISGNSYFENLGKTQNTGFETALNVKVVEDNTNQISWYIGGSALNNKSKLLEISNELKTLNENNAKPNADNTFNQTVYYEQGQSLNNIKGVLSLGIDPATGREVFVTQNGTQTFNWNVNDIRIIGNTEPKLFGTLNTSFGYQQLSVQAYFNYTLGGDVYNETLVSKIENVSPYLNGDARILNDRWKQPGDVAQFKAIGDQTLTLLSSRFVQRENYIRFSALNINYEFKKSLVRKYNLERLKLNFSMNDVFRISTVNMERGLSYPFSRTYNCGVLVQF